MKESDGDDGEIEMKRQREKGRWREREEDATGATEFILYTFRVVHGYVLVSCVYHPPVLVMMIL